MIGQVIKYKKKTKNGFETRWGIMDPRDPSRILRSYKSKAEAEHSAKVNTGAAKMKDNRCRFHGSYSKMCRKPSLKEQSYDNRKTYVESQLMDIVEDNIDIDKLSNRKYGIIMADLKQLANDIAEFSLNESMNEAAEEEETYEADEWMEVEEALEACGFSPIEIERIMSENSMDIQDMLDAGSTPDEVAENFADTFNPEEMYDMGE